MFILLLGIAIVAFIAFLQLRIKYPNGSSYCYTVHDFFTAMSWVFGFITLGLIITICWLSTIVATESTIDSKIAMYQEENTNIEQDIDEIIDEYLKHEQDTFEGLKTEKSSITLVTLFPELKSDTLVKQQLEIYVDNTTKIISLKEEKIDISKIKWILYFGK